MVTANPIYLAAMISVLYSKLAINITHEFHLLFLSLSSLAPVASQLLGGCPSEIDPTWNILWPSTPAGQAVIQNCPGKDVVGKFKI